MEEIPPHIHTFDQTVTGNLEGHTRTYLTKFPRFP